MDKKRKKSLSKKYRQEQRNIFINSIPFDIPLFESLFDKLDEYLEENVCDNTLKCTMKFLNDNNLPLETSLDWLMENGGYCDCEVLLNVEEKILEF